MMKQAVEDVAVKDVAVKDVTVEAAREQRLKNGTPSIAVAFGGGGARGLAHIHVIKALNELGLRPVAVSGSSIGALMGAGMAAGMSGREIEDYSQHLLGSVKHVAGRVWRAQKFKFSDVWAGQTVFGGFDATKIVSEFLPRQIPAVFEQLQIPLQVTGTDFYGHKPAVFNTGDLRSALAASIALPVIFTPVRRDGMMLVDGGLYDPVPFGLLRGVADIIIAVDVVGVPHSGRTKAPTSLDMMFGATQIMMQSIIATRMEHHPPDIMLRPNVGNFRVLDFMKIDTILDKTRDIGDQLKRELTDLIEGAAN